MSVGRAILVVLCGAVAAKADYVVAARHAVVHQNADSGSAAVVEVERNASLALIDADQTDGYYHVQIPGSAQQGWVYRTFVRRYAGSPAPAGTAAAGTSTPSAGIAAAGSTTGVFHGCPPEGDGGDPDLNRLKNRDLSPPANGVRDVTVSQLIEELPVNAADMGRKKRSAWTAEARSEVGDLERHGIRVQGVLIMAKVEGPEACNCHSATYVDHHLWLADDADTDRTEAMVVEISPRLLGDHPAWKDANLQQLVKDKTPVRITGWPMWDQEHPEQLGKTRGTLWEIHPIHQIEVMTGGQWHSLDG